MLTPRRGQDHIRVFGRGRDSSDPSFVAGQRAEVTQRFHDVGWVRRAMCGACCSSAMRYALLVVHSAEACDSHRDWYYTAPAMAAYILSPLRRCYSHLGFLCCFALWLRRSLHSLNCEYLHHVFYFSSSFFERDVSEIIFATSEGPRLYENYIFHQDL